MLQICMSMNKGRGQKILIIGLVLLNVALLAFLYLGRPPQKDINRPKRIVIDRLGFDNEQIKGYEALVDKHQTAPLKGKRQ